MHKLAAYQFELPQKLIAQQPCQPRDASRLMVIDRKKGSITEIAFRDLIGLLHEGDQLVFNDTKVIPARLLGKRATGGQTEILLMRQWPDGTWEALARPAKKLQPGSFIYFAEDLSCEVLESLPEGKKCIRFHHQGDLNALISRYGLMPLPHYIEREQRDQSDDSSYQTIYAKVPGSAAAPTAGLHFTESMLNQLDHRGVSKVFITLHVGVGTFRPVRTEDIRDYSIHHEHVTIPVEAAERLNAHHSEKKQICIGTTTCRSLESAAQVSGKILSGEFDTDIFIYPGYSFKYTRSLLTNFHLPGSSLLMLVCAFAGYDVIMEAYSKAIKEKYRFFSYGDAMLIL